MASPQSPIASPRILTRIVPWSHQLLREVLLPGDLAVDLTAGKGRDTLALAEAVGPEGRVVAFDVQLQALCQAEAFLRERGLVCSRLLAGEVLPDAPGIYLVHACHSRVAEFIPGRIHGCLANLGYLPGGDTDIVTRPESTQAALQQVLKNLVPGGRLAVVVYPGHAGGSDEGRAVESLFADLPIDHWRVLRMEVANRLQSPYLLIVERSS